MTATVSFPALGTTAVLVVADPAVSDAAASLLRARLQKVDLLCSRFRDDSELADVNRRQGSAVRLSAELYGYVRAALDAAQSTGGLVDPALGNELRALGYDRTFALVAARGTWHVREVAVPRASWRRIELDDNRRQLRLPHGVELDLGATAKARAADLAAQEIATATGVGTLVALGGDIAVAGAAPPDGWCVLVSERHDDPLDGPGDRIGLSTGGLATSSTTTRTWSTDRGPMHHVIDPRSGKPADPTWRSATVAARSCLDANIASTAALVLGCDALRWLESRGVHGRLIASSGAIITTHRWPVALERVA